MLKPFTEGLSYSLSLQGHPSTSSCTSLLLSLFLTSSNSSSLFEWPDYLKQHGQQRAPSPSMPSTPAHAVSSPLAHWCRGQAWWEDGISPDLHLGIKNLGRTSHVRREEWGSVQGVVAPLLWSWGGCSMGKYVKGSPHPQHRKLTSVTMI